MPPSDFASSAVYTPDTGRRSISRFTTAATYHDLDEIVFMPVHSVIARVSFHLEIYPLCSPFIFPTLFSLATARDGEADRVASMR